MLQSQVINAQFFCGFQNPDDHASRNSSSCQYPPDNGTYYLPIVIHNFSSREITGFDAQVILEKMRPYFEGFPQKIIPVLAKKDFQGNCFDGVIDYLSFTPFYLAFDNFINTYFPNGLFNQYEERYINVIYVEDINLPALGWIDPFSDFILEWLIENWENW